MHTAPECSIDVLKRAFRRLLSFAYYDTNDMHLRRSISEFVNKISNSQAEEDAVFEQLHAIANGKNMESLNALLDKMSLLYFPKQLKNTKLVDKRFFSSKPREENVVAKFLILSYIPVELLIIDVAWILQYGYALETLLSDFCLGNRLVLNKERTLLCEDDKVLFYNYSHQYKRWWMNGIKTANDIIEQKKNVTIINLDITNYYHSVDLVFDDVITIIEAVPACSNVRQAGTTEVVRRILEKYSEIAHESGIEIFNKKPDNHPLPLSLLSSSLLANWYLKALDDEVNDRIKPLYYARYVDDVMLVVESKSSAEDPLQRAQDELIPLLKRRENGKDLFIDVQQNMIDELIIQQEKVYVYSFDTSISQIGIQKYVSEQVERSSEFRFLTDEVEPADLDLDNLTLISALDANSDDDKRFDILEMSRYKLAVYFTKLSLRLAKCASYDKNKETASADARLPYEEDDKLRKEVDKIHSYFRGAMLIKHYKSWEKIMTVFVLSERCDYLDDFVENCKRVIRDIQLSPTVASPEYAPGILQRLRECLRYYLEQSGLMASSLNWNGRCVDAVYSDALMVRSNYNSFPLQEFSCKFVQKGVKLSLVDMEPYSQILSTERRWVPYHVKFADLVCACSLGSPFNEDVYKQAWKHYCRINAYTYNEGGYNAFVYFTEENGIPVAEFNTDYTYLNLASDKIRVSLVEMELEKSPESMIKLYGKRDVVCDIKLQAALDKVSEVANTNLFVMPECSLSLTELREFYLYSSKHKVAFICGLEYYICGNNVYNYLVTCLPIMLHGRTDAVPVIRRKCFYAPKEVQAIVHHNHEKPSNEEVQVLYHWCGHIFTSYCCYELCNPKHRSFFFGKIDAMYCPVNNRDTYYFNNIAESTARDMHCYFVLSNVSRYGDSRVSYPAKHDRMNLMKVTGGTTKEYAVTILSCLLEYEALRNFQKTFKWEEELGKDEIIKPLPPGYHREAMHCPTKCFVLFEEYLKNQVESFLSKS